MRIAILTTVHTPLDGRILYKQAVTLTEAGHRVTLYAPCEASAVGIIQQYGITYVPLVNPPSRFSRPLQWLQLGRLLRAENFDCWHFHDPELLPLVILWKKWFKTQVSLIYDVHEDVPKDILDKAWIPRLLRQPIAAIVDKIEKWGIANCNFVIAATDSIHERVKLRARRSAVVRNYPLKLSSEYSTTLPRSSSDPVQVIYCGNSTEPRGTRVIVQAMDYLQDCNVKLTLLGLLYPDHFAKEIHQIAGPNVQILPKVPFEQVPQYLMSSDIGIVCFQPGANHIEAMPNKLFEYMQARLPIIASDFPLWRTIIEGAGCGIVVDPSNPQKIAEAIRRLIVDKGMRQRMSEASAKAAADKYSWQNEGQRLVGVYNELLNQ